MNSFLERLKESLENSLWDFGERTINFIPDFLTGLIVLILGIFIAKIISSIIKKVLDKGGISKLGDKLQLNSIAEGASEKLSSVIAKFVKLFIILIFGVSAADIMGMDMVGVQIDNLLSYLPSLISAVVVFFIGYFIANMIRGLIRSSTKSMGMSAGPLIANLVFYFMLIMIALTALKQAQIETDLLSTNVIMFIGSALLAAGISYGIASRHILSNVLATFYTKDRFKAGQTIEVDGIKGVVVEVTNIAIIIMTDSGKVVIPSHTIITNKVRVLD